jgi:hypothetical protein
MSLNESWRELCEAVVNETDPEKLMQLTEQLIVALDERKPVVSGSTVDRQENKLADDSSSLRPAGHHTAFLRCRPSLSATTCS